MKATAIAHANIALVKYWGRNGTAPKTTSVSVTMDALPTRTTVEFSDEDSFVLNGAVQQDDVVLSYLNKIREHADVEKGVRIVSQNGFPTGTGLASSSSGFCALTAALGKAFQLDVSAGSLASLMECSPSGSALRSLYGGFVQWDTGNRVRQLFAEDYWPELRNIAVITDRAQKAVRSSDGMQTTVATSTLYASRLTQPFLNDVTIALQEKNPEKLFTSIMRESNNLHAVMLDSWPPLLYLTDASRAVMDAVRQVNRNGVIAGYTFDAGQNAHVFTTAAHVDRLTALFSSMPIVKDMIVCKPGPGVRFSEDHLQWKN